jgi:branched-chain amino acid transport system ATP-binding protein
MATLKVSDLKKHFGGVKALDGVSFEVRTGQCVALIGPNGAGKSTCFATLAGQHRPSAGTVEWGNDGQGGGALRNITGLPAAALSRLGIGRTFQVAQVFEALTVLQNLQLVEQQIHGLAGYLPLNYQSSSTTTSTSQALLAQLGLSQHAHSQALLLPYGLKKRLELGIALAARPQLLLLDEPAAGLAPSERHDLMALVKSLTQPANAPSAHATPPMAVLYTEHNMDAVFGIADRVLVLIDGQLAAQGSTDEIKAHPLVQQRYLGRPSASPSASSPTTLTAGAPAAQATHG